MGRFVLFCFVLFLVNSSVGQSGNQGGSQMITVQIPHKTLKVRSFYWQNCVDLLIYVFLWVCEGCILVMISFSSICLFFCFFPLYFSFYIYNSFIFFTLLGRILDLLGNSWSNLICLSFDNIFYRCRTSHQQNKLVIAVDVWSLCMNLGMGWDVLGNFFTMTSSISLHGFSFNLSGSLNDISFWQQMFYYLTKGWFFSSFTFYCSK